MSTKRLIELQEFERAEKLVHELSQQAPSLSKAAGAENLSTTVTTKPTESFMLNRIRNSATRNDMSLMREQLDVFRKVLITHDSSSRVLTTINSLLTRIEAPGGKIGFEEFLEAANAFSKIDFNRTVLRDEINNKNLDLELHPEEITEDIDQTSKVVEFPHANPQGQEEDIGQQAGGQEEPSSGQQPLRLPQRTPARRVIIRRSDEPRRKLTDEEKAQKLQEKRERVDQRKKRAQELWKRRAGLAKPGAAKSGWGIFDGLAGKAGKWLADKLGLTRAAKWLADKTGISNLAKWLADKTGLTYLNNALNAAKSWLGNVTGYTRFSNYLGGLRNSFGSWLGNTTGYTPAMSALRGALSNLRGWANTQTLSALKAGAGQLGNLFSATRAIAGQVANGIIGGITTIGTAAAAILAGISLTTIIVIVIIISIFLFYAWLVFDANSECNKPGVPELIKSVKNGTDDGQGNKAFQLNQEIEYKIQVTYKLKCGGSVDVEVKDNIPVNTAYVEGSANADVFIHPRAGTSYEGGRDGDTLLWKIKLLPNNYPINLSFKVTPNKDGAWIANEAQATFKAYSRFGSAIPDGGDEQANQETCKGKLPDWPAGYIFEHPTAGNFGDPSCSFSKNSLHALLKQSDPINADYWFDTVARKESGYNPNTWANPATVGTPDAAGAWGLFQMGRGKNGDYDHGDVAWQKQTSNAVNYNNYITGIGRPWCYWQAARERWPAICRR